MRLALVVNPDATRFAARRRDRVVNQLAARHKLDVYHTTHIGHATELARRAVADGVEAVVVMGGDGTVNEVVNGLPGAAVPLGLVGGGKTNVLARSLGLPDDVMRATARLLELLESGERRRVSLGLAGGRRFTFSAGLGLDGAIVREVERRHRAKQLYGDRAYVAAGLMTLLVGYDRDTPHLTLHAEGSSAVRGFFALVGNGDPFTYLGPRPRPASREPSTSWSGSRWRPWRWPARSPSCCPHDPGPRPSRASRSCTTWTASRWRPTCRSPSSSTASTSATTPAWPSSTSPTPSR
jgi:diacylglycerol kinase family enzyme